MGRSKAEELQRRANELGNHIAQLGNGSERISTKYTAHMSLFNMAAAEDDKEGMEKHRSILHDLVDNLLDNGMNIFSASRELDKVKAEYFQSL